eukprot:gene5791-9612_t
MTKRKKNVKEHNEKVVEDKKIKKAKKEKKIQEKLLKEDKIQKIEKQQKTKKKPKKKVVNESSTKNQNQNKPIIKIIDNIKVFNFGTKDESDKYQRKEKSKIIHHFNIGYKIETKIFEKDFNLSIEEGPLFKIQEINSKEIHFGNSPYKAMKKLFKKFGKEVTSKLSFDLFGFNHPEIQNEMNKDDELKEDTITIENEPIKENKNENKSKKKRRVSFHEEVYDPEGDKSCPICGRYFSKYVMEFHLESKHSMKEMRQALKILKKS